MKIKMMTKGKAAFEPIVVSQGLAAKEMVLPGEKKTDLIALRDQVRADLRPMGDLERALADRVALCLWRLRRVLRVEAGYLDNAHEYGNDRKDPFGKLLSHYGHADKLILLTRYETSIERSMFRALRELRELQKIRASGVEIDV